MKRDLSKIYIEEKEEEEELLPLEIMLIIVKIFYHDISNSVVNFAITSKFYFDYFKKLSYTKVLFIFIKLLILKPIWKLDSYTKENVERVQLFLQYIFCEMPRYASSIIKKDTFCLYVEENCTYNFLRLVLGYGDKDIVSVINKKKHKLFNPLFQLMMSSDDKKIIINSFNKIIDDEYRLLVIRSIIGCKFESKRMKYINIINVILYECESKKNKGEEKNNHIIKYIRNHKNFDETKYDIYCGIY